MLFGKNQIADELARELRGERYRATTRALVERLIAFLQRDGVAARAADEFDFAERLEELHEELEALNTEARMLEERIAFNVAQLLEQALVPDSSKTATP